MHRFTKMTPFTVDEVGRLTLAHDEAIDIAGKDAGQIAEQIREYAARKTYPLYCVDRQDRVSPEKQYLGPYDTHDGAHEHAEPGDLVRRCRRVRASEVGAVDTVLDRIVEDLDARVSSGEIPDAWGQRDAQIVHGNDGIEASFRAWLDAYVRVDLYICEGEE